ncbi:MAG: DUF397 domain-containing protein [Patescibacteria group bacterium]
MKAVSFRDDEFRKSGKCGWSNSCVEVAIRPNIAVAVRNSNDPAKTVVTFTPTEWSAFIHGVKNGEFELS